jgi:hypothetical protein
VPEGEDQPSEADRKRLDEYEESFRRAGLPLFSEDISAWEDIFNRAAPLLGLVLLGELLGERLELSSELLRVAVGLAAFSGFYFAIAMFTDSTYRDEFLGELTSEMRRSFKDRGEYLRLRQHLGLGPASG